MTPRQATTVGAPGAVVIRPRASAPGALLVLALVAAGLGAPLQAAAVRDGFDTAPSATGWRTVGEPGLFAWNPALGRVDATWDSSRSNTFFLRPLGTTLTRAEDFRFACTVVLDEIRTVSPDATFQLALGLVRARDAEGTNFFRGAGVSPQWGPRNLVEIDYFPASRSITPTFSAVAVGTNNLRWAMANLFPFEFTPGDRYRLELAYAAAHSQLSLRVERNGEPWCSGSVRLDARFGDFRVDAFSFTSYSGDHQPAGYGGDLYARGWVDDLELDYPDPPVSRLAVTHAPEGGPLVLTAPARPGWQPRLEHSADAHIWTPVDAAPKGPDPWTFEVPVPAPPSAGDAPVLHVYRLVLDRP